MAAGYLHVIPTDRSGWRVEVEGPEHFAIRYESRQDAIRAATEAARRASTALLVHGADGRIIARSNFG